MADHLRSVMQFHVSRRARDTYAFDESLFTFNGNVIFANFLAARTFAQKINAKRPPGQAIRAGHINALGLLDEMQHYVVRAYREQKNPRVMQEALEWLNAQLGVDEVEKALRKFVDEFPPIAVYKGQLTADEYLKGATGSTPHHQLALEEMLMLWLANLNPACAPFLELFDDTSLERETAYPQIMSGLRDFFAAQPTFGPGNQNLIDLLRAPALAAPHSLAEQLEFIKGRWGFAVGQLIYRLLSGLDFIKEEDKATFSGPGPARGPALGAKTWDVTDAIGGVAVEYAALPELEKFTPDRDWMPRLVLIAKNSYVWLDQLSKKYRRAINRLDLIPDEELDALARWGFTGLWLIGLWERSRASQHIKQLCGNPEAVASAYSLLDYRIADDLGGEAAMQNLKERAARRGIRMASDMVPNHMGIDSTWVMQHPDWFVALDYSPFPSYSFNGPDLSNDERVGIFIEDHYFNRSDAAVVFKRVDRWTGSVKYIYHGNDGTSFPWNDTAQLDYLKPEVREAVIQTILHVARQFPVIRFDAAMTLAKKHFQRLWFPEPGTGGAIPSRAEFGLTRTQLDQLMPEEFWREVVDRAAVEAPDTLLLAEAFWMMEGYFVRTLGMHRVYNSAFMNLLRDEDNAKYRTVMKNTLEFDPEVLKRYVNFMNNPDERTAVDQFGKNDKYFGVCVMMATLPGLPMFGHGQLEGFTEKYGMEYRRAYWEEQPDQWLIDRHAREIFPLLHKRKLFAEVENFLLYDFYTPGGSVDENVFAYSNRYGSERSLVVYHNKFADTRGWVRTSAAYSVRTGQGDERVLVQKDLGEGLGVHADENAFVIFRDHVTDLEFIRGGRDLVERGLYVELGAYKYAVYLDFREVYDDETRRYARLAEDLQGGGVPSIEAAARDVLLRPVQTPFKDLVNAGYFNWLLSNRVLDPAVALDVTIGQEAAQKTLHVLHGIQYMLELPIAETTIPPAVQGQIEALLQLPIVEARFPLPRSRKYAAALQFLKSNLGLPVAEPISESTRKKSPVPAKPLMDEKLAWGTLLGWASVRWLGQCVAAEDCAEQSRAWIDEWWLGRTIEEALRSWGLDESAAWQAVEAIKVLTLHQDRLAAAIAAKELPANMLERLLADSDVQQFLHVNRYNDVLWFNQEAFEQLLGWLMAAAVIDATLKPDRPVKEVTADILAAYAVIKCWQDAEDESEYQVEKLLAAVK